VFPFTLYRVEPALDVVQETSGYRQIPVPLRPFPAILVMVVLLSLLPRRTVTARATTSSHATASTATAVGSCATRLLTMMMVLVVVVAVMVMMVVVVLLRRRPVLVLLRLLPVVPPFSAVILMRYHAVHDGTADVVVVRRDKIIRSSHTACVTHVNQGLTIDINYSSLWRVISHNDELSVSLYREFLL